MSDEAPATTTRPVTSNECMQQAARVLHFAERETDSRLFDQYMTLADRWMELGSTMGDSE